MADNLLKECPLLVALDKEKTVYDGFISVQDRDFRLRITLPPDHQLKQAKLHCCWELKRLLKNHQHILKQRLHHSSSLVGFILELRTVLEIALKSQAGWQSIPPPQYYSQLITEIESLGWDKLIFIDTDFRTLKLKADDSSHRQHVVIVKLKSKYPVEAPECSADLPVPLVITWTPQIATLNLRLLTLTAQSEARPNTISYQSATMIYELPSLNCNFCLTAEQAPQEREPPSNLAHMHSQFLLIVEALAEFWAVMDEIDEHTWVLEPEKPSRADTMRRIAIGNNVSIKVEIDPRHPKMLPECCLLGAEHAVTPLRGKLNANMHLWNPDCSVLQNMKDVMEIEFPSPATHEKSSFSVECGICYSYRLDSAIPDQVCNDPRCGQPFHQACLYEWLRGLPTSRQSFNIVFGECPYCSKQVRLGSQVSWAGLPAADPVQTSWCDIFIIRQSRWACRIIIRPYRGLSVAVLRCCVVHEGLL
ncbi:E3 ubiquitin-protein ligase FANCL [Silurus asotus]|uniref:E3 ubiquitin-protein ligase FANCL n=1 Tax=Silurus asotus TaxID=30991 RepID=A0AAD5AZC5_SILAS|nr:E3 ubiquitin-protein ligase FANCL [Silurus asotus]